MSLSAATLILPASDTTWRVWRSRAAAADASVESPSEVGATRGRPLVVGLPASACRTIGLVLPYADAEILEAMLVTHLERKGLRLETGDARNFRWHLLAQTPSSATLSVDVLVEPFPEELALQQAHDYTAALRLLALPAAQLVVIEERGALVLAVGYQGKLYHSHLFAPATVGVGEIALEIRLAKLALEQDLGVDSFSGITLVGGSWNEPLAEELAQRAGLPVRLLAHLPPNPELDTRAWQRLLPTSVREAQTRARRRSQVVRFSVLGALMLVALMFLAFAYLRFQERTAAALEAAVAATAEPALQVKKTVERWKALAPAIESKRYPMFMLAEITRMLPPSGIVIREFEVKDNDIDIRGEARDAQLAVQFVEDLRKSNVLGRYTWTNPQPTLRNNVAQFRAQGKAQ